MSLALTHTELSAIFAEWAPLLTEAAIQKVYEIGGGHSVGIAGETKSPASAWEISVTVVHEQRE